MLQRRVTLSNLTLLISKLPQQYWPNLPRDENLLKVTNLLHTVPQNSCIKIHYNSKMNVVASVISRNCEGILIVKNMYQYPVLLCQEEMLIKYCKAKITKSRNTALTH